ncbi:CatB-related O-acetyltransferase [Lysinibacillus sp. NPDC097214]|uniref:CatB-related O-acetyltransferase n=1 Tax=Lysinibacillus sp. NPDC097214 TaxID=3390584 RepID=UPI003D00F92A
MRLNYLFSKITKKIQIPAVKNSKIDKTARVCSASHIVNTEIGRYSYVGNFCTVVNTKIGNFCSIADNSIIGGASHPIEWVSTSPVFHEGINIMRKNFSSHEYKTDKETIIGNDVWIGNNSLIKSGVFIADGAVIGMGSVLTKDVGAYEIWAGNPAKFIRKRFSNEVIEKLNNTEWWNYSDSQLKEESINFNDVNKFTIKK